MSYQDPPDILNDHTIDDPHLSINILQTGTITVTHNDSYKEYRNYKEYKDDCDDTHTQYMSSGQYSFNSFGQDDGNYASSYVIVPQPLQLIQTSVAPVPPSADIISLIQDTDKKIIAHMQVFTLVKEQTTDKELFRHDIDNSIEFSGKDLASYSEFRNALRQKTQAGYLKTQFFRVCLLSEIEQYKAPINNINLSRITKPDQEHTHKNIMNQINWIVDDKSLQQALNKYYLEQQKVCLNLNERSITSSVNFCSTMSYRDVDTQLQDSSNSSRLRLAVVRFTKTQAQNLGIEKGSLEYKYYIEAMTRKRAHNRNISESGRYMGEWLRGNLRLYDDVLMQNNKSNQYRMRSPTIQDDDHVRFVSSFNEFAVPRSLGYVMVRNCVTSHFLDFIVDLQQACMKNKLPPLKALAQMTEYSDFYHTTIEPLLNDSRQPPFEGPNSQK